MQKVNRIVTQTPQSDGVGQLAKQALTSDTLSQGGPKKIVIAKPFQPQSLQRKREKRSKKQSLTGNRLRTALVACPDFPPPFDALRTRIVKRRWNSAENVAISSQGFTLGQGHSQFLVVTATGVNDTGVPYVDCWRIKKVSIWCNNSDENSTTVTVQPNAIDIDSNCFNDREGMYTCSSRSASEPGQMAIVPAPDTPMGCWHRTSSVNSFGVLFYVDVDYGGASSGNWASVTMDIDFEVVENEVGNPQGFSRTTLSTGHTLGTLGGCNLFSGAFLLQSINTLV